MPKKYFFTLFALWTYLCLCPSSGLASNTPENSETEKQESHDNSVWGAMKFTGHKISEGGETAGHGIEHGGTEAGRGIKKGGQEMEKGFKKAGRSIKGFFVGD